jgi:hypothetical protein
MNGRVASRNAVLVIAAATLLSGAAILLATLNAHGTVGDAVLNAVITGMTYPIVGGVIIARAPGNSIGWVLAAVGLLQGINNFTEEYAYRALVVTPGSLPFGAEASWYAFWTWMVSLGLLVTLMLLLFPTGHPPTPGWRWIVWLVWGGIALIVTGVGWAAWPERASGLDVTGSTARVEGPGVLFALTGAVTILLCALASVASLFVRYRRSRGVQRLQLKWFTFAGVFAFIAIGIQFLPPISESSGVFSSISLAILGAGLLVIPVAIGIAVLRYRLYDIDRIINRSVVYAGLTAILVLGYAASVLVLQAVLPLSDKSPVAVAASTLAMAALFGPLRARIQAAVDKRFYRARYNAAVTVENFGARLRRQTDLDALTGDLLEVVAQTVQPLHASLWLRGREGRR